VTLRISVRRRVGGESLREWKGGKESSLLSQWDTEWDDSGDCGIERKGKLVGFERRVRGW